MIIKSYVVPHPPIILPEIGNGEERKIQDTVDSMDRVGKEIGKFKPETIIITSPHAKAFYDGFYMGKGDYGEGSLAQFGRFDVFEKIPYDRKLADEIIENTKDIPIVYSERIENNIDHGAIIPIRFIKKYYKDFKIVILGISGLPSEVHYKLGMNIKKAVEKLDRKVVFIASGDLSHVLKEDGPYGFKKEGPEFDKKIIDILSKADFKALVDFPKDLIEKASQCGIKSFQIMAGAFDGCDVEGEFYSYEGTFGVGYGVLGFSPLEKEGD